MGVGAAMFGGGWQEAQEVEQRPCEGAKSSEEMISKPASELGGGWQEAQEVEQRPSKKQANLRAAS